MMNKKEAAALLIAARLNDVRALARAGRASRVGLRAVAKRQVEMIEEVLAEGRSVMKAMALAGPLETLRRLGPLGRATLVLAWIDLRELARLAAKTQGEAVGIVARRLAENLDETRRLFGSK